MNRLWAPWRLKYIQAKKKKECVFCACVKNKKADHLIFKSKHAFALLNIYPYNNGHVMVAPRRHVRSLGALSDEEILDIFKSVIKAQGLLQRKLKPQGFNIGINLGKSAGAGIAQHMHIHIVPRWNQDTNFMPVIFGTKVISQSLKDLKKQLKNAQSEKD